MEKEFVLYGVRKGNPDWQEEVIIARKGEFETYKILFENVKKWAEENGFNRFRLVEFGGETAEEVKNAFVKALNI